MSNIEEKSVRIIEFRFSSKQAGFSGWSKKFLAQAKKIEGTRYKSLLLGKDKVPTHGD